MQNGCLLALSSERVLTGRHFAVWEGPVEPKPEKVAVDLRVYIHSDRTLQEKAPEATSSVDAGIVGC